MLIFFLICAMLIFIQKQKKKITHTDIKKEIFRSRSRYKDSQHRIEEFSRLNIERQVKIKTKPLK